MKASREHRVPLCDRAIEIIGLQKHNYKFAFPGAKLDASLSNMAMLEMLRGMVGIGFTVHGFLSAFMDWGHEVTNYPKEMMDIALAHTVSDKVEAAYRRGDMFDKRRQLMADWQSLLFFQGRCLVKFIDTTDFSLGSLGSPTQLDVLTLEAYMLAPSDEVARQQIRTTTGIEFANRHRDQLPNDFFRDLFRTASDAKPLQTVREESYAPFKGGFIAGAILHHAIGATTEGLKGNSVSYAVSELSRRFGHGYSRATIHNLWREFKTVSHYWAAYVSAGIFKNSGAPYFPCTVDSLAHFLATADAFRELGQSTRAWKSPETRILPCECVRLDCGFALPTLAGRPPIFFFSKSD